MPLASKPAADLPWSERHRPRHLGQVVGNTDQVRKLAEWLRDWDEVVLRGKVKEPPQEKKEWQKFPTAPDNVNARAALVSGPPGIGKTTTCSLLARCNPNYKLMEYNASDARSKAIIDGMSQSLAGNHTLRLGGGGKGAIERAVIIMDECDGMAGGGDKGGMQALINMIKTTKNPIICICNDRGDQQVRNLATHCYDIKFRRPENVAVAKRIKAIMDGERKQVELASIEAVVEACGQDIRQVINQVQFFGSISAANGKKSQKDTQVMLSPFDACIRLLSGGGRTRKEPLSMNEKLDMFYIDASLMPLMVQENYLRQYEKRPSSLEADELSKCAAAAEMIATADSMSDSWEVQSAAAVIGTIYPAFLTSGDGAFTRPSFPAWLQKYAPMTKAARLLQEVHSRVKASTTCSCRGLVTSSYHDLLHRRLLKPLQLGAPKDCAVALAAYGLSREFFTEQAPAFRAPLQLADGYKQVDGKVKYQLQQELQSLAQQAAPIKRKRAPEDSGGAGRGRGGRGEDTADVAETGEAGDTGPGGDEEDDMGMAKKRKAVKAKAPAKAVSKSSGGGGDVSKTSLAGWIPSRAKQGDAGEGGDGDGTGRSKPPILVLKFIEGHTCAVRRRVRLDDILGPWLTF